MPITDDINQITSSTAPPPTIPPNMREARDMLHWASVTFLVMAAILALIGVWNIVWGVLLIAYGGIFSIIFGVIYFALAFLAFYAAAQVKKKVIPMLDMGNVKGAKDESVKWLVVGLFTGFIPFIFMLLAYLKLDESPQPHQQYQQAPPGYAPQQSAPQNYQAPPQGYPPQQNQYPAQQPQNPPQAQSYQPQQQAPPQNYQTPPQQAPQNQMPPQAPPSQNYAPPQPQSPPPSGVPPQVMRCPNCGAEVQPGMTQCPNCGAMLR